VRVSWIASAVTAGLVVLASSCGDDGGDSAAGRGAAIYRANCSACHGADLRGAATGPSLLLTIYGPDELSDAAIRDAIRNGVSEQRFDLGEMPANRALGENQVGLIIDHIRDVQAAEGLEPVP